MNNPQEFPFYNKPIPKIHVEEGLNLLYFSDEKPGNFFLHSHDFIEVMFVLDGKISISAEGARYPVDKGSVVIMPKGLLHCTIVEEQSLKYERFVLHIDPKYIESIIGNYKIESNRFDFLNEPCVRECSQESRWRLRGILDRIFYAGERTGEVGRALLQCHTMELMITFLDIMNRDKRSRLAMKNPEVGQIIEHINKNFTDPALAMGNITSQVYLSPGYISRLFKEYTGTTIYNFLMQKRLEHAKELIKDGWMVTHACMECGFTDYTSFLKAFKKAYKMTPKDYQKEYTTKNTPGI